MTKQRVTEEWSASGLRDVTAHSAAQRSKLSVYLCRPARPCRALPCPALPFVKELSALVLSQQATSVWKGEGEYGGGWRGDVQGRGRTRGDQGSRLQRRIYQRGLSVVYPLRPCRRPAHVPCSEFVPHGRRCKSGLQGNIITSSDKRALFNVSACISGRVIRQLRRL